MDAETGLGITVAVLTTALGVALYRLAGRSSGSSSSYSPRPRPSLPKDEQEEREAHKKRLRSERDNIEKDMDAVRDRHRKHIRDLDDDIKRAKEDGQDGKVRAIEEERERSKTKYKQQMKLLQDELEKVVLERNRLMRGAGANGRLTAGVRRTRRRRHA